MGKQTALHVQVSEPKNSGGSFILFPSDTITDKVEIINVSEPDTISTGNQALRFIKQDIVLQSFDSGLYPIGPLKLITPQGDTVLSNRLSMKVLPADVDSLETIHSFAPVISVSSKWWDFIPDIILDYWLYLIIAIVIIAGAFIAWLLAKKKLQVPFIGRQKTISPYDLAIESLDNLRDRHLCEQGREKEYYTELTDILRRYLQQRFDINAMEMTSTQILASLDRNQEISRHHQLIERILEIADFVKFAKVRPLPTDNVAAWNNAKEFVIDTKPEENQTEENNDIPENSSEKQLQK